MLTELPIISTGLPVFVEKLDTGGGIVAEDIPAITEAMERLAREPETRRRMGEAGRETALERYCWDTGVFIERFLGARSQDVAAPD